MATNFHVQQTTSALVTKGPGLLTDDLDEPLIMNMTMAQLYGTRSNSRAAAQVLAAMEEAVARAGKRNPALQADDIIFAALGVVQKIWDRRMNELRAAAWEPRPTDKPPQPGRRRRKRNRLTGFLG